jgi:acetyl-CoA acetyltransferase
VVIYRGVNGRSGRRYGRGDVTGRRGHGAGQFTEPCGVLTPQHALALKTRRRMHETGITSEHFGMVAVTIRQHANRNPRATFYERPLTLDEHQSSRLIVEPLHLYDCCLETDGAGAIIVTSPERARELRQPPAYVRAAVQGGPGQPRSYIDTSAVGTGPRLWQAAGLGPGEVDVVQIYDHFSPFVIFALEDYGFVRRGDGGPFVASGGINANGGRLPVNTSGGQLSEAYMQGMNLLIEATRQVRGQSTAQVHNAAISFVDTGIGSGAAILARDPS